MIISLLGTMGIKDSITISTTLNHDLKNLKKLLELIRDSSGKRIRLTREEWYRLYLAAGHILP